MNGRCAGLAALVLLLGVIGIADAKTDFHAILHSGATIVLDSAYLIVPPDSLAYPTTGWGVTGGEHDTFDFPDSLDAWPQRVRLKGIEYGFTLRSRIEDPHGHRWYPIDMSMEGSAMFYGADEPGVVERRLAEGPLQRLAVSPSIVTGQMTLRVQPVGTGRQVIEISDAVGNVVRSLDCTAGTGGAATATWNREDDLGRLVPEGVYFCRYAAADVIAVRKVLVAH